MKFTYCLRLAFALGFAALAMAIKADEDDFVPLFNGRDLSGWVNVNCAPNTFTVRDGMIISTGVPTGVMRTDRHYENFIVELEYRHMKPGGNAGFFVWSDPVTAPGVPFTRSIEVQILDGQETPYYTSHGDVFSIHGARMTPDRPHPGGAERSLPSEKRAKPSPEWNHYRIECNDGVIKLAVNGKVVSGGSKCTPRKGYICIEAEGSEAHFRNLKIKELPSTNPKPNEIAAEDQGFKSIYTGVDLSGWKTNAEIVAHWKAQDWILAYDGKATGAEPHLWTEKEYGDFVMICDWRWVDKGTKRKYAVILPNGDH
ncbi:MAG: family 16 glycoside hydrolase, partial [Verrucomicrobiales bacterium]